MSNMLFWHPRTTSGSGEAQQGTAAGLAAIQHVGKVPCNLLLLGLTAAAGRAGQVSLWFASPCVCKLKVWFTKSILATCTP